MSRTTRPSRLGVLITFTAFAALAVAAAQKQDTGASAQDCTTDADCDTTGAKCVSSTCQCTNGNIMSGGMTSCLEAATAYGSACTESVQCAHRLLVGGTCDQDTKTCVCAQGYHYYEGRCWKSAGLGEPCTRSERCFANHDKESVTCSGGVCVCAGGFYQREYSACRRISTAPGDECGITQDCQFAGSVCTSQRACACSEGTSYDAVGKACVAATESAAASDGAGAALLSSSIRTLRTERQLLVRAAVSAESAEVFQSCTRTSDCSGAHTFCDSGRCVCERGYFTATPGQRSCSPEILSECSTDADCSMSHAVCRSSTETPTVSRCSCKSGYVPSEDNRICRKMSRTLGWSCLHDEQCGYFGPGGLCVKKKCRCSEGTHFVADQLFCWVSKGLGATCQASQDCSAGGPGGPGGAHGETAECGPDKICRCVSGHHVAKDNTACRPDVQEIGGSCELDDDCMMTNSRCLADSCACAQGYIAKGNTCIPGVGGACASSDECTVAGSSCVSGTCSCAENFVPNETADACLQEVRTLTDACTTHQQCAGIGANCTDSLCACAQDQHFRDGYCWQIKKLGESCTRTSECYQAADVEETVCRNGECQCRQRGLHGEVCTANDGNNIHAVTLSILGPILTVMLVA